MGRKKKERPGCRADKAGGMHDLTAVEANLFAARVYGS